MISGLPADKRARVRFGPVLTKQWTDSHGGDYERFDPGPTVGDFFGVDSYVSSNIEGDCVMPGDVDGKWRADWIRGLHAEVKSWRRGGPGWTQPWSFAGWIWWNDSGKGTGEVPQIGQRRDFPLHLRSNPKGSSGPDSSGRRRWMSEAVPLPAPAAPLTAYNEIWRAENSEPLPA
ncbi:hypothetical protein ACFQFC_05445 [Amorphoplanes digitatis]|uniref:Uncharacterized protein n=1 Tax=Actinoplanes digitatis TaxID=1868 RepID=A0A7W7HZG4_9ACTN|nr:hypothetical protein [Actinoplanes digitatis]MBB4763636.1 hypothetical protein [Actinoplanes digitatis]GID93106.1 hypothetical protein Adi01nite_25180 [Actinoplanes digitatis]